MKDLWQDIRYAARMLWKSPGFTVVAVLALGLGIGANSAIFSAINGFLLRPLPVANPGELVTPFETTRERNGYSDFSYPDYVDYRDGNEVFSGLIGFNLISAAFSARDDAAAINNRASDQQNTVEQQTALVYGELVTGNYFDVLGVRAQTGRTFTQAEDRVPGAHPVVVISDHLWRERFAADSRIVGRSVTLNNHQFTIVGVAPPEFYGTKFALSMDFWVPMMMQAQVMTGGDLLHERGSNWFSVMGRLKPGVTLEQAEANLTTIRRRISQANGDRSDKQIVAVVPESDGRFGLNDEVGIAIKLGALVALIVVFVVLLIACANVANLLLARAAARRREIGIRTALGASRARIVRQLLTESLLLALMGGALGLLLAFWTTDLLFAVLPKIPYRFSISFAPDARVLVWTAAVALLTGVVFGLAPALVASKTDIIPVLKSESSGVIGGDGYAGRSRLWNLRNSLVVAQVALSFVVLVCAGLFIKSLNHAVNIDPGFDTENIIAMSLDPAAVGYTEADGARFYQELKRRVEALPAVESSTTAHLLHLGDSSSSTSPIIIEGTAPPQPGEGLGIHYSTVSPDYFRTLGIRLVAGRDFTERDSVDSAPVVIINETTARQLFPNENAIGKRFATGEVTNPYREIIGIARDAKYRGLGESPRRYMYQPFAQHYNPAMTLLVRTRGQVRDIAEQVRGEIQKIDSRVPVFDVKTMRQHLDYTLSGARIAAWLSVALGALALLLAALGLFGVMSYTVAQRTREIGIRIALGARPRDVVVLFTKQGVWLALVGLALGLGAALLVTRFIAGLLYNVNRFDATIFVGVPLLLALVGFFASYLPARRATKVDPMIALRYE